MDLDATDARLPCDVYLFGDHLLEYYYFFLIFLYSIALSYNMFVSTLWPLKRVQIVLQNPNLWNFNADIGY